ncbi:MAG TPA: hypothetical protein VFM18_01510 [Methanosarcina sp.]|nr:hypothetical protein [Methanosarcina sp.]
MRIKIINVDIETKDNGKGRTYEVAEVLYSVGDRKNEFKLISFSNPAGFAAIKGAKKGDEFDITVTKNQAGYNQWADVKPAGAGIDASSTTSDNKPKSYGNVQGRDYETKEERAHRQALIVRQSSLTNAIAVLTTGAKTPPDPEAVKKLAQEFVDFVFVSDNVKFDTGDIFEKDNDLNDDIPY